MIERLGVIVIPRTTHGDVLLLPQMDENTGKQEMVLGFHSNFLPVEGFEFAAGAVEERDRELNSPVDLFTLAAMRELAEEAGIVGSPSQFRQIPETIKVKQMRDGKEVDFTVILFELLLTNKQEEWLADHAGVVESDTIEMNFVRPRDQAALVLLSMQALSLSNEEVLSET